uniref:non-specific serine/threonine protein kinase n=1 Tax=Leersia perrieri TaxID=77586 RepID=A0A0D9V0B9_9ORYZ
MCREGKKVIDRVFGGEETLAPGFKCSLVHFKIRTLQNITDNFHKNREIGSGGFGKVYKGILHNGTMVAVKRANSMSEQRRKEFLTEIELISQLRHINVMPLFGFCEESNEMILVYEYMEQGTLMSHLYGSDKHKLTWKQRLQICIAAARGLHYIHTYSKNGIIHRDVKTSNILLDANLLAKISDFGLSEIGPGSECSHVITKVMGTDGYCDPEYYKTRQLTQKSDVYSFGVVQLEVLCARLVFNPTLPLKKRNLLIWAMEKLERAEVDPENLREIVDQTISRTIEGASLLIFVELIKKCLADNHADCPLMEDVIQDLRHALELQGDTVSDTNPDDGLSDLARHAFSVIMREFREARMMEFMHMGNLHM